MQTAGAIGLDDSRFTTAEIVEISGVPSKSIQNWQHRGLLDLGEIHFSGRRLYSLANALQMAVMHGLTARVPLKPSDAVNASDLFLRYVLDKAPVDDAGFAVLDVNAIPRTLAYALAVVDGDLRAGLVDPKQPGGYAAWQGDWGHAHIVLPIAAIVAGVQWRAMAILSARPRA